MPNTSSALFLVISARLPDLAVVRKRFQSSDALITQISSLEEFDHRFMDDHFDMIIVDREMLMGPTNSTMADLQMLSQQSSSLVISELESFVDAAIFHRFEPENPSPPRSESPDQHLDIISQSVRCISHENRNVLQRIQLRLESLENTLNTNALNDHDVKRLKCEFGAIHNLFETTKLICNPINLNKELTNISKIVNKTAQELLAEIGPSLEIELLMGADDLVWMDLDGMKMVISKLFHYLLSFIEAPPMIRVAGSVGIDGDHRICQLSFEAETKTMGKRPNDLIDLALARRIVLLHDGQLDITTTNRGKTVCVLSLPLG